MKPNMMESYVEASESLRVSRRCKTISTHGFAVIRFRINLWIRNNPRMMPFQSTSLRFSYCFITMCLLSALINKKLHCYSENILDIQTILKMASFDKYHQSFVKSIWIYNESFKKCMLLWYCFKRDYKMSKSIWFAMHWMLFKYSLWSVGEWCTSWRCSLLPVTNVNRKSCHFKVNTRQ